MQVALNHRPGQHSTTEGILSIVILSSATTMVLSLEKLIKSSLVGAY